MPMLIEYIDAIARKKKRDVLSVAFDPEETPDSHKHGDTDYDQLRWLEQDWENHSIRKQIILWLDENGISWQHCGDVANPNCMPPYMGQIYIDVPYDKNLPEYQKLETYLENPDGSMRLPGVNFYCCPLEMAMKNAEHDEPGFWERWAENF